MKQFLVIQTAFLGDAVLVTSILEKLHAFYPDAAIDLVVRKGNEGLFTDHPFLRKLHVWDKRTSKNKNLFALISELRSTEYDHIINCQRFLSTGLMTVLAKGKEKIGYDKNPLSLSFTRRVKHTIGDGRHEVDRLNDLIEHLTDGTRPLPMLHPTDKDRLAAQAFIGPHAHDRSFITVAPASVWYTKQWPVEKWAELLASLPMDQRIFLLGGPGDKALCEDLRRRVNAQRAAHAHIPGQEELVQVLAGELTLLGTAAVMERAAMNHVNDSAPLHIASAMNAPVTAVFCSTVPSFGFGPLRENGHVVETTELLDCRPCGLHGHKACPKGHFKCALGIDARAVVNDRGPGSLPLPA